MRLLRGVPVLWRAQTDVDLAFALMLRNWSCPAKAVLCGSSCWAGRCSAEAMRAVAVTGRTPIEAEK